MTFMMPILGGQLLLAQGVEDIAFGGVFRRFEMTPHLMQYNAYCDDFGPSVIDFVRALDEEARSFPDIKIVMCVEEAGGRSPTPSSCSAPSCS